MKKVRDTKLPFKIEILMNIWPNFPMKLQNGNFFLKSLYVSKFLAPSAPKIWSFMPQKPEFFGVGAPPWAIPPLIYLWQRYFGVPLSRAETKELLESERNEIFQESYKAMLISPRLHYLLMIKMLNLPLRQLAILFT